MKHLTGLIVYKKNIPNSFISSLKEHFNKKIEICITEDKNKFFERIEEFNLCIINSKYHKNLKKIIIPNILIVTENQYSEFENLDNRFIFDPFRNEDRSQQNFNNLDKVFVKTVDHALKYCNIPLTPNDLYQTIIELD